MNNYNVTDFIDLTNSFTLIDHCALANTVIDLDTDDSIIEDNVTFGNTPLETTNSALSHSDRLNHTECKDKRQPHTKHSKTQKKKSLHLRESTDQENKFGSCPICWEEVGKNPLVSTKCGHVYCLKCLERSLCLEKRCPTCRSILKGKHAYHPLYLPV